MFLHIMCEICIISFAICINQNKYSKIGLTLCNFCVMIRKRLAGAARGLRGGYAGATPREGAGWLPRRAVPSADFSKEADGAQAAAGSASTYIHVR